jgi:hypothetical protein
VVLYDTWRVQIRCNGAGTAATYSKVLDSLAAEGYWHVFLDGESSDQWNKNAMLSPQTRAKVVDAILTGDEVCPYRTCTRAQTDIFIRIRFKA